MDISNEGRQRRSTWATSGVLLIAAGLLSLPEPLLGGPGGGLGWIPPLLLLAAALVLAIGFGPTGSVTGRRPLGTAAVVVFAAASLIGALLPLLVPAPSGIDPASAAASGALIGSIGLVLALVALVSGLVAAMGIGRAGVVPRPWNWAPLWAFVVGALTAIARYAGPLAASFGGRSDAAAWNAATGIVDAVAVGLLGVVAVALALRGRTASAAGAADAPAGG